MATGTRTLVGALGGKGFNPMDNYICGIDNNANQLIKVRGCVVLRSFTIPNLPAAGPAIGYNVGNLIEGGFTSGIQHIPKELFRP